MQLAALVVFIYQMTLAVHKYSTFSSISIEETEELSNEKLPSIYICLKGENMGDIYDRYGKHGYRSLKTFMSGVLDNANHILSWAGSQNLTYKNITSLLYSTVKSENIKTHGKPPNNWKNAEDLQEHSTSFNGVCKQIEMDITNLTASEMFHVTMGLKQLPNRTFPSQDLDIIITHPKTSTYFMMKRDSLEGEQLQISTKVQKIFSITLEEYYMTEESGECKNYGEGAEFRTFADCVADEHKRIFQPIIGCALPWASAPGDQDVCHGRIRLDAEAYATYKKSFNELFEKIRLSQVHEASYVCLKPCFDLRIKSKLLKVTGREPGTVTLNFQKKAKVTKSVKAYGLFDLIVEVGSCLGLWIGLSALGVFDLVLDTAKWIKSKNGVQLSH